MTAQFDPTQGQLLKDLGMEAAANARALNLSIAQSEAEFLAKKYGSVTADDVQETMTEMNIELGNAAGSIFRGGQFEFTGRWVASRRTSNHGRFIRVWKLKP